MNGNRGNTSRWRRKRILVNNRLQLRFTALLLLQMSVILAVLGLLVHSQVQRTAEIALSFPFVEGPTRILLQNDLIDHVQGFFGRSLVLMAVTAACIVCFGLIASHKLAGPALKLQSYLAAVGGGDFSQRIAFRRYDHLDEFAVRINRMAEAIECRHRRASEIAVELARRSEQLGDPARRERFLAEATHLIAEYRANV